MFLLIWSAKVAIHIVLVNKIFSNCWWNLWLVGFVCGAFCLLTQLNLSYAHHCSACSSCCFNFWYSVCCTVSICCMVLTFEIVFDVVAANKKIVIPVKTCVRQLNTVKWYFCCRMENGTLIFSEWSADIRKYSVAGAVTSVSGWATVYILVRALSPDRSHEWHCRMVTMMHAYLIVSMAAWSGFVQGPWPFTDPGMNSISSASKIVWL